MSDQVVCQVKLLVGPGFKSHQIEIVTCTKDLRLYINQRKVNGFEHKIWDLGIKSTMTLQHCFEINTSFS